MFLRRRRARRRLWQVRIARKKSRGRAGSPVRLRISCGPANASARHRDIVDVTVCGSSSLRSPNRQTDCVPPNRSVPRAVLIGLLRSSPGWSRLAPGDSIMSGQALRRRFWTSTPPSAVTSHGCAGRQAARIGPAGPDAHRRVQGRAPAHRSAAPSSGDASIDDAPRYRGRTHCEYYPIRNKVKRHQLSGLETSQIHSHFRQKIVSLLF